MKKQRFNATRLAYRLLDGLISDTYSNQWFGEHGDFSDYTPEQREKIQEAYDRIHDTIQDKGKDKSNVIHNNQRATREGNQKHH